MVDKIPVSEASLASFVEDCLDTFGWRWVHQRPARTDKGWRTALTGNKGFPDYVAIRTNPPPSRLLFLELKTEKGKLSAGQIEWISALEQCQKSFLLEPLELKQGKASVTLKAGQKILTIPEIYCWRPSGRDKILEVLR